MKCVVLLTVLAVVLGRSCDAASIVLRAAEGGDLPNGEAMTLSEMEVVADSASLMPEEVIAVEEEVPKMMEEEVPLGEGDLEEVVGDSIVAEEVLPVAMAQISGDAPADIIDTESAAIAEKEADEDLLKALDTVLENGETIDGVMRSEDSGLPLETSDV